MITPFNFSSLNISTLPLRPQKAPSSPVQTNVSQDQVIFSHAAGKQLRFKGLVLRDGKLVADTTALDQARALKQKLEALDNEGKRAYVQTFCDDTGFPNLEQVSQKITEELKRALIKTGQETGIPVVCSAYAPNCSLAQKTALPGVSDIDGFIICIEGDLTEGQTFVKALREEINPRLVNLKRVHDWEQAVSVVPADRVDAYQNFPDIPEVKALQNNDGKVINTMSVIQDGKLIQSSDWVEPQYALNKFQSGQDIGLLFENLKKGTLLVDNRPKLNRGHAWETSELYQHGDFWNRVHTTKPEEAKQKAAKKHAARTRLIEAWPAMSVQEQFLIVRMFDAVSRQIPVNLTLHKNTGETVTALKSLQEQGFLDNRYGDPNILIPTFMDQTRAEEQLPIEL